MSNYSKSTNFATKDALISGDVNKIVKGTELDLEFTNIQVAVATKLDSLSPVSTGTASFAALTVSGAASFVDGTTTITGSADATKKLRFEVDTNVPTATTLVVTPGQGQILPAGIGPLPYAGSTVPTGWLECDGSSKLRTDFPALFTAIGTTWGSVDATHFTLPDMRGRVPICDGTGTVVEALVSVASSGNGVPVASNATKWVTGMPVTLSNVSGFGGTIANGAVFVVRISSTNIRFATTLALAQNITADITITGTGTVTITGALTARTLGQNGGEETHAMNNNELLAHTHVINAGPNTGGSTIFNGQATAVTVSFPSNSTGGNVASNIMQPFIVTKYIISY